VGHLLRGKLLVERGEFAQGLPVLRDAFETCDRRDVSNVPPPDSCTAAKYRSFVCSNGKVCRIFSPNLPAQQFGRAGLRPKCRGGGGTSDR
jgi:hypothetical protein